MTQEQAAIAVEALSKAVVWMNNVYQVNMTEADVGDGWPPMLHLSIKRRDKKTIRDWRHLQQIKNELVGSDHEGVEIFPAESRLVDSANQYHLWVLKTAGQKFPFGWTDRLVKGPGEGPQIGAKQRPFA